MTVSIAVLGSGLVGRHIARDLSRSFRVTAFDADPARLAGFAGSPVECRVADLSRQEVLAGSIRDFDAVVGALPGWLGRQCVESVLSAGKDIVDIAFFPEDPFGLEPAARDAGRTAVVDIGLAPGLSNLLLGRAVSTMGSVQRFECMVGGLPVERRLPFEYKAPFSPADVLEEYTRPARLVEGGRVIERPALSDPERVDFPGIGTLEAFNTDGLRTLIRSYPGIPSMKEKTLRYPGHARLMETLRDVGFLSPMPVRVGDHSVAPLDLTSALLFPLWQLKETDEEFTVMRVEIEGTARDGAPCLERWELIDRFDPATRTSSMARTTGFTCAAAVHLLLDGRIPGPGVVPPERLGEDAACFDFILGYLEARQVRLRRV